MNNMDNMDNMGSHEGHGDHGGHGSGMSSDGFCNKEMAMTMFMDGFRWALKDGNTCLNLYFPGWTLDTRGKVVAAMFGVIGLAILTEAISVWRHKFARQARGSETGQDTHVLRALRTGLHGVHATTGYILMLATMTFSIELFLCVIVGLAIGYLMFADDQHPHITTNPCCSFLEDEAKERRVSVTENANCFSSQMNEECCTSSEEMNTSNTQNQSAAASMSPLAPATTSGPKDSEV